MQRAQEDVEADLEVRLRATGYLPYPYFPGSNFSTAPTASSVSA
jgi:hypothetical protein